MQLPALRRLALYGERSRRTGGRLHLDRRSFLDPGKLESLTLMWFDPRGVTLAPDLFPALTALAALELRACALASIPAALAALAGTLTRLALPFNDNLQLEHDDVATLLELRNLRTLDLRKHLLDESLGLDATHVDEVLSAAREVTAHLHYEPVLWSSLSMQYITDLRVFSRTTAMCWI